MTITHNRLSKPWLALGLIISMIPGAAMSAASDAISVNPSIHVFKAVAVNTLSNSAEITIKNTSDAAFNLYALTLSEEPHGDQYQFENDNCSGQRLEPDSECTVSVQFAPKDRGYKQALLNIPSDVTDTPLQMFLTNKEDRYTESSRRLPPVLYAGTDENGVIDPEDMDIPEILTAGHTLKWSILGYHDDYTSIVALFDCTGKAEGTCGSNYSENFYTTGSVASHEKTLTNWHNNKVYANKFKFEKEIPADATAGLTGETDIVVRFYRKNTDDKQAGNSSLSLLVPGNLSDDYYDKEGRRLKKKMMP